MLLVIIWTLTGLCSLVIASINKEVRAIYIALSLIHFMLALMNLNKL